MFAREAAHSHKRGTYWSLNFFCKFQKLFMSSGNINTTTSINNRVGAPIYQFSCFFKVFRIEFCLLNPLVSCFPLHWLVVIWLVVNICYLDILWNINYHWTWTTAGCNVKCFSNNMWQLGWILHNIIMLGNRHGDTGNVNLLKGIST